MGEFIIESVKVCKLVKTKSIPDGHDCWGNSESYKELYVKINDKEHYCSPDWYIKHDGNNAIEILFNNYNMDEIKKNKKEAALEYLSSLSYTIKSIELSNKTLAILEKLEKLNKEINGI